MYALKKDIQKLRSRNAAKGFLHLERLPGEGCRIITPCSKREYRPVPTLARLHAELPSHTVALVMGPYGSGKSVGLNVQAVYNACDFMPPCRDGVRRVKCAFIRNTYDQLKQTTYDMFLSWFSELGGVKATKKPLEVNLKFNDAKGPVWLDVQFVALDRPEQYAKLRSSFYTFAYINEVAESPEGIIPQVLGRTGRYPSADLLDLSVPHRVFKRPALIGGKWEDVESHYWSGVICDTNPPETDSELYRLFEVLKPTGYAVYKQPPGLIKTENGWEVNRGAENLERLGLDYYAKQAYGASEEYIRVFCCGEYGSLKSGELVYADYNDNIHSGDVKPVEGEPLRLSFDTWFTPACVITQWAGRQLRVLAALQEEHITVGAFASEIVLPYLQKEFPGYAVAQVTADPACMAGEKVHGASSDYSELRRVFGNKVIPARTNALKERLNAVSRLLCTMSGGSPAIIIDRTRCEGLRRGFLKHYVWRTMRGTGQTVYEPVKNSGSHPQDALQYDALGIFPDLSPAPERESYTAPRYFSPAAAKGGVLDAAF